MPREVLLFRKELLLTQLCPLDEPDSAKKTPSGTVADTQDADDSSNNASSSDMSASSMLLHLRKLRALFEYADVDNSGSISRKELLQAVR